MSSVHNDVSGTFFTDPDALRRFGPQARLCVLPHLTGTSMDRKVFWLVPAAEYREPLLRMITELAAAHGAPVFGPHLTLGAMGSDDQSAFDAVRKRLKGPAPLELKTVRIQTGSEFTHSLFLTFASSDSLTELMAAFPIHSEYEPHLSLLYCPSEQHGPAVRDLTVPFPAIEFDEVWIVPMAGVVRSGEDVTGWQASERVRLSG